MVLNRIHFVYNSAQRDIQKTLPHELVERVRIYLEEQGVAEGLHGLRAGELQELLLTYKEPNGEGLLINQLEPIFTYLCRYGEVWSKYV